MRAHKVTFFSENKRKILQKTLDNLAEQIKNTFNTEAKNKFNPKDFNVSNNIYSPNINETDASLYVLLLLHPIEATTEITTKSIAQSSTNRPIQSTIIIDPKTIPETSNTDNDKFAAIILQKVLQVMGFSKFEINNWATQAKFENDAKGTHLKGAKIQRVLSHRFGIDEKYASIQLIDDGDQIAAHPAFFLSDAISMVPHPHSALSDLTIAVMEETGWYKGKFTSAEKVTYGLDFTNDTFHGTFSPRLGIPSRYKSDKAGLYASQDYRSIASVETQPTGDLDELLYDPTHVGVVGIKSLGYVPLKVPTVPCDSGKWALDTDDGPACFKIIKEESKLFVEIDNEKIECEKEKKVGSKNITCPHPDIIEMVNKTINEAPYDYDKSYEDQEKWPFILVAFFSFCSLMFIILAIVVCIQRNNKGLEDAKLYRRNIMRRAKKSHIGAKNISDKVAPLLDSENDTLEEI